ncbi:preprotein translocase subunit SecY [Candidatus Parcubacteria bacterium]|nr:preprotein translocase subunit SecY [Candidatus Parcubacteria bacterium]
MQELFGKLALVWTDRTIRNRILFVFAVLAVFRFLAAIPIPGIDAARLAQFLTNNQFFGLLNIFSGGGLSNLSIVMLGVGPYITASIIMQLLTMMIPSLKQLYHEEGELGRRKFTQYSRLLTVPLAVLQGLGLLILLERQGILVDLSFFDRVVNLATVTGGTMLLMWLGELISEFGIGNGVSILIFSGIVARLPSDIAQLVFSFDVAQLPLYLAFIAAALLIVAGVVFITEAERPLPVTYAKRVRGMKVYGGVATYLPLRLNQAGVIPIIFALSILLFPQLIGTFLASAHNLILQKIGGFITAFVQNHWLYGIAYFLLVFLFTYFYTAVIFEPNSIAENLQKNGAFIPGVRPGRSTAEYIGRVLNRITLFGALFLGIIAILPLIMQGLTGLTALAIGGTALLIVVSVVLDLVKKIEAQVSMREY